MTAERLTDRNDDLSSLALEAAIQLELLRHNRNYDKTAIDRFWSCLLDETDGNLASADRMRKLAPTTLRVYGDAVHAATKAVPKNSSDITVAMTNIGRTIQRVEQASEEEVTTLVAFCSAIHRAIATNYLREKLRKPALFRSKLR